MSAAIDLDAGLARLGYAAFRPGQREAIETLLAANRLLLVAPTGGGKSLIYQLPGILLPGTTLVISPLIALMHDQVAALEQRGVAATFLASTLPASEMRERLARLARGELALAYVAPERLTFPGFRSLLHQIRVPLVAVDEAHCISEWGHDFRPEYMEIGGLLAELPASRLLACTATATPIVRDEILVRLGLGADTPQLVRGFARPNLALCAAEVRSAAQRARAVDDILAQALGGPGSGRGTAIVYAMTRQAASDEARRLAGQGWQAEAYHAGLSGEQRDKAQRAFAAGRLEVVSATNAFGMGIDRADVRAVVHLSPPGSIEAYYQEVGRAGRDGEPAWGLLLHAPSDLPMRRRLIEGGSEGQAPPAEVVDHKWNLFLELLRLVEGGSCRHDAILRYFGDESETLGGCGRCDVCASLATPEEADPEQVTLVVRKALSAVARIHGRFGLGAAVKLLAGVSDPRLERAGLHKTKTFGALHEHDEDWLTHLLRRCLTAGWVTLSGKDRPLALLTDAGRAVMMAERPARLVLPGRGGAKAAPRTRGPKAVPLPSAGPGEEALFDALRRRRLELARAEGVPAFVIASDRTLRDIATLRPRSLVELGEAYGIGAVKAERYGSAWLEVVAATATPPGA